MKTAIVAGGGSGIGRGCALQLAARGYEVTVVGRTEAKLAETVAQIVQAGGTARAFVADVRDWDRLGELHAQVADRGLDTLVNSAGGQFVKPAAEISPNGWRAVVGTNLDGAFFLCRQLYPALRKARGAVVHIVSDIWRRPVDGMAHSSAARAGVVNLTQALAREWARDGIRVNAVAPGFTETEAVHRYPEFPKMVQKVPLGARAGTVGEVVDAILFLAQSQYITGEFLTVDGGMHLIV
jgi:citronellol/citronellal dehydrogenase